MISERLKTCLQICACDLYDLYGAEAKEWGLNRATLLMQHIVK